LTGNGWVLYSAILVETREGVSLSQAARRITGTITFKSNLGIAHAWLFNSNSIPSGSENTYNEMDTGMGMNPSPITWVGSLTVNNVSGAGQTAEMSPGQTVYIRVSSGSTAWGTTSVHSFVLQEGEQTVTIG
jgi:hypothetical protein